MMKPWIAKAIAYLQNSLSLVPQELNELDWTRNPVCRRKMISYASICAPLPFYPVAVFWCLGLIFYLTAIRK